MNGHSYTEPPFQGMYGFKVYLKSMNETVVLDRDGIMVTAGTENFLSLGKAKVRKQHKNCNPFEIALTALFSLGRKTAAQIWDVSECVEYIHGAYCRDS